MFSYLSSGALLTSIAPFSDIFGQVEPQEPHNGQSSWCPVASVGQSMNSSKNVNSHVAF
jgi:hypothetical protein